MSQPQDLVVFCMEWMPSYRRGFYEQLEPKLAAQGIAMSVVHGLPPASRSQRRDHSEPDWATLVPNRVAHIKGIELTWQPVWRHAKDASLIIAQQEAANLFNYYAMARRRLGGPRVALWGHGENPDPAAANPLAERVKAMTTPYADWFFAYTDHSAELVRSLGMADDRITTVNNSRSFDNAHFNGADAAPEVRELCSRVTSRSDHIGWMASALDESKRLPFLIETLDEIRARIPDFEFFVLGRGPSESVVFDAAASRPWLHAVGARFDADKVAIAETCSVMVHPGLLGLHVIDAFAFETPIVTTEFVSHSHEFDYLEDAVNASILAMTATSDDVAAAAVALLRSESSLDRLKAGCRSSAALYSLEEMTDRFSDGLVQALSVRQR